MFWSNCAIIFTQKVFEENCVGGGEGRDIERVENSNNYFLVEISFFFDVREKQ